ncbi:MAG: diacylglycerol kinase family lipid kinase [Chloroflexi bacterium]|nr:diacylglycerol kinase family lipid kinase [Chloroflexota bacterium]
MRRARLIINPIPWARRAKDKLAEITNLLDEVGIRVDLTFTKLTESMTQSVGQAAREGYDLVIVGGGDGTVSEVAAGLVWTGIPLGILPCGTFNNIAHSLGLSLDLLEATRNIARGNALDIDVGVANGVYFFEAVGVGLDASLFPIGEEIKEGHYEKVLQGAVRFLRHRKAQITLHLDQNKVDLQTPMVVVANGPYYGASFTVAPQASLTDGRLEVVVFECSKVEVARHFALSARNRAHEEPCISMYQAQQVSILPQLPLPAHADGKPIGNAPVTCRIIPRSLRVIVP